MVSDTEELHTVLVLTEAAFARGVIESADAGASWTETSHKLGNVRGYCRELRAAIAELDAAQSMAAIDTVRAYCRELRRVFLDLNPSATIPFRCDEPSCSVLRTPRTTCWRGHLETAIAPVRRLGASPCSSDGGPGPAAGDAGHRSELDSQVQETSPEDTLGRPSLLRQSIGLLALVLGYFQFYYLDVHLQILGLRSVFP